MRFSHFFIRRPIFAGVIAIIITIVGAFAYFGLPVSQFPEIVPPTVTIKWDYYPTMTYRLPMIIPTLKA